MIRRVTLGRLATILAILFVVAVVVAGEMTAPTAVLETDAGAMTIVAN